MLRLRRALTLLSSAVLLLTAAVVAAPASADLHPTSSSAARASGAGIYSTGVFSVAYSGDLYEVTSWGAINKLSFQQWQNLGSPAPRPAGTNFVKYAWSPSVYAVTFFGTERSQWVWKHISFSEWQRAGSPTARDAGWIQGTYFYRWGTSSEIFAIAPDGAYRKLSYGEWTAAGSPTPDNRGNEGFIRYSWDSTIVRMSNLAAGQGTAIGYQQWSAEAFPTPRVVNRVAGDQVYTYYRDSRIWYAGPGLNRQINYNEWAAMGFPSPTTINPARPANDRDCGSYTRRRDAQADLDYWYPLYGDVFRLDGNRDGIACNALPW